MNKPIRILLVDDSPFFLEAARDFIQHQEAMSVAGVAVNAEEAVARLRDLQPDVILLDLNLARSSGLELIPVFKENLPAAKIVVLTIMEESSYRAAALQAGADDFVPKNDMGNRLVTVIHGLMGRSESAPSSVWSKEAERRRENLEVSLDDLSDLICRFRPDGTLTYVNDAYCRYYGRSREELIGSNFISSAADDFPQKLREHLQAFTPDQPVIAFEQYDILPNGEKRWREWVDRAFFDKDGKIVEFQSTGRDITERKRAEMELRGSRAQLQGVIHSTMDAILSIDEDHRITLFNPAAEQMFGCPASEAVGSPLDRFIPETARGKHREFVRAYGRSGETRRTMETRTLDLSCLRADGTSFPGEISISHFEMNGRKTFIASIRDITERKRAEMEVRESEDRYRDLVENTRDLICTHDLEGRILTVNRAAIVLMGYKRSELIGKNLRDFLLPQHRPAFDGYISLLKRDGMAGGLMTILTKRGEARIWEYSNTLRGAGGVEPVVRGYAHDITARKRAEEALREGERRYRQLFESNPHPMWVYDLETLRFLAVNDAAISHYGYSREEFLGMTIKDIRPSEDVPRLLENVAHVTSGLDQAGDWRHLKKDGSIIDVEIASHTLDFDGHRAEVVHANDITARKQAEERLAASEAELRALFAAMRDVVLMIDRDGIYRKIAPTDPGFLYRPPDELLGKSLRDVFPPADAEKFLGVMRRVLETKQVEQVEYELPIGGRSVWFSASITPMTGDMTVWVARDITERKQAEERIQRQVGYLSALAGIDRAILSTLDVRATLKYLISQAASLLNVDAATVLLLDPYKGALEFGAGTGFRTDAVRTASVALGEGYAGRAALERRKVQIHNLAEEPDNLFLTGFLKDEDFVSYYGAPLIVQGRVVGVLEAFHRSRRERDQEWFDFFGTLAGQAAIAIDNARLVEGIQVANTELLLAYDATIEGWSRAMDLRDRETEGHTRRVAEMTLNLARLAGMSDAEMVHVRRGALLHDMGKLGVPDSILYKRGALTDDEWKIMRRHPQFAFDMLSPIAYLKPALDIPYYHHEKWDGTGYPHGLRGEEIPLAARLFAVADVWDALTSDRPYRPAWSEEKALEYIKEQSGRHFDPQAVELFFRLRLPK